MNKDIIEGKWDQIKADVKGRWAKLTDSDLGQINAKKDMLVAKVQERYGIAKDEAEKQTDEWLSKLDKKSPITQQVQKAQAQTKN